VYPSEGLKADDSFDVSSGVNGHQPDLSGGHHE
jgi:hypothetical protein